MPLSSRAVRPMTTPSNSPPLWLSFDCYGTLIDWEGGVRGAFQEVVPRGKEAPPDIFTVWERIQWELLQGPCVPYAEVLRTSFQRTMDTLGYDCPRRAADAFLDSLARWEPFPDVNSTLIPLSQRYKLAVISNIDRELLGVSLRRLAARFEMLMTAEDTPCYKPNPTIFQLALKQMHCAPEEVVHVAFGAAYDLAPASSLGFRAVYFNRQNLPLPETPVEGEIRTAEELLTLWKSRSSTAATSDPGGTRP